MAENFNLIFGSQAPETASWSDADYQTGWNTVGSTPPTAEQFDALQNRSDKKAQELNNRLSPLEQKAQEQGRQAGTAYAVGAAVTVDGLPADWLLVCTVAGTSGTNAITLPDTLIDGLTITDGAEGTAVTWTLRKIATNGSLGYRQPSTSYAVGAMAYHASLPAGYYLECTTAGTTSSGALTISGTITPSATIVVDGTVTWLVRSVKSAVQFNKKETFTSSGTFVAPVTGTYRITLQGGGGGGSGAGDDGTARRGGGGGGQGGYLEFYAALTSGQSYSYIIGAGGAGSASDSNTDGDDGGTTTITIGTDVYSALGGKGGRKPAGDASMGGSGGTCTINNVISPCKGASGTSGSINTTAGIFLVGGAGGGTGGTGQTLLTYTGVYGGGGHGGTYSHTNTKEAGTAGGNGYITFEYCSN